MFFINISQKEYSSYTPEIRSLGFRFELKNLEVIRDFVNKLASPLNFSFIAEGRPNNYFQHICIEQNVSSSNDKNVFNIKRQASFDYGLKDKESKINIFEKRKRRNESMTLLEEMTFSINPLWKGVGKLDEMVKNLSTYEVSVEARLRCCAGAGGRSDRQL